MFLCVLIWKVFLIIILRLSRDLHTIVIIIIIIIISIITINIIIIINTISNTIIDIAVFIFISNYLDWMSTLTNKRCYRGVSSNVKQMK